MFRAAPASRNAWRINCEIGDLSDNYLGQRQGPDEAVAAFRRYDAPLEADWLRQHLERESSGELDSLRDFTNPHNARKL